MGESWSPKLILLSPSAFYFEAPHLAESSVKPERPSGDVQDKEVWGKVDSGSGRQMEDSSPARKTTFKLGIKS